MFKVENLSKSIRDKKILSNISFEVNHGEIALFLGGSGVGKSTLLRILNHLESSDEGAFILDGNKIDLTEAHKKHLLGMVFQNFNLFEHLNVEQNITLGLEKVKKMSKEKASHRALALLSRYGLQDKASQFPKNLSGGQKQRLAIARTIAMDPKIICFDEPTSALDPLLTKQVAGFIEELAAEGRIILLTTHDTSLLKYIKAKLFLMENGTIVEKALSADYFASPEQFPKLFAYLG